MQRHSYSVDEFGQLHGLSRATLYNLWRAGRGPVFMKVGSRRLISEEAAAAWRRQMEAETASRAA